MATLYKLEDIYYTPVTGTNGVALELTMAEARQIDTAIRMLRDRHFRNHFNAKDPNSESAQAQRDTAKALDELRNRITSATYEQTKRPLDFMREGA